MKAIVYGLITITMFAGIVVFTACNALPRDRTKIEVTSSFYPLYFFAEQIGGDKADIINITPAGVEPHAYEPASRDIARMEKSDILILNGGGLEAWGDKIKQNVDLKRTIVVTAVEGLTTQEMVNDSRKVIDSHVWLSPILAKKIADKIVRAFTQVDSANAYYYQSNADKLKTRLDDLDKAYRDGLKNCEQKSIVTSHAAFGYLAAEYGFNQVPIAGLSPEVEPSPRQLANIARFVKMNNIKYIFFENLMSPELSRMIANETGARELVLNPVEGLSPEEIAQGKNYFTIMQENLQNLQKALLCEK